MKMERMNIQIPAWLKRKLEALCPQSYTMAGYIRSLLAREFKDDTATGKKGR